MTENVLTKKLGPLPVWGWAVAIVAGYLVYRWWKDRQGAGAAPVTVTSGTSTGIAVTRASQAPFITSSTSNPTTSLGTGQTWVAKAQAALQGIGYTSNTVDKALQAYVSGSGLDQSQHNIVTAANKLVGSSSIGSVPTATVPTTATTKSKTPVAGVFQHAYTNNVFAYQGNVYSPVATWEKTLTLAGKGVPIFLKTTATGMSYQVTSVTQLKSIEHTGTAKFKQYTTYTKS